MKLTSGELLVILAAMQTIEDHSDIQTGSLFRRVKSEIENELQRKDAKAFAIWRYQTTSSPLTWN
jgi:hypothetical protein